MPAYRAPQTDIDFLLHNWLGLTEHYQRLGLQDFDKELVNEIISQGAKFAEEVIAPLNQSGDEQGCQLVDGKVTTPKGFAQAYQDYIANGWNAMLGDADYGGQDLPYSIAVPVHEMLHTANMSWRLISMLTESAVLAVSKHGDQSLKETYLAKLISGEWTGTMCLTEPQAGTDLSLLSTKAEPNQDGSYSISGSKIFISGGDQDWTENVIHLVLARLPDAPQGVKGISLFLVPKCLPDSNGEVGELNDLSVGSLEHKMGIKGCPTCVMHFNQAKGWLVGGPHQGLACMFTMMNDARFQVGLQGLGVSEASYQGALTYALERLQSRAPQGIQQIEEKADSIIHQPDVRRMLLTQQALTEGCRALAFLYAQHMDIEKYGDLQQKEQAQAILAFLTPICKGFMTDMSIESTSLGIQIFGGHGYIREWGMEQLMRDARITLLYEGTNGIQANDLISRKLARDGGKMLAVTYQLFADMANCINNEQARNLATEILSEWKQCSDALIKQDAISLAGAAHDYLQYSAYSLLGVIWLSMADCAKVSDSPFAKSKADTCAFYVKRILPRKALHRVNLLADADDLLSPSFAQRYS
jgi:alkylation response protein AidB-like acyl-CoA dehydrogenase